MNTIFKKVPAMIVAASCALSALGDELIDIHKDAARIIKVSVSGFTDEAQSVLTFDLSVLGMEITAPDIAEYQVSGHENGKSTAPWPPAGNPCGHGPTPAAPRARKPTPSPMTL